tara:strand:- start:441271 stop:442239 length:969 start_codon:yes stop_codon:yes gene_type:complete
MKKYLALLIVLIVTSTAAQNFAKVDSLVKNYPSGYSSSEQLADQIKKDFTTDIEKVRAVYTWLALNISYDLAAYNNGTTQINFSYTDQADFQEKLQAVNTHSVNETFRRKKAVCEGYAQSFKKVSELLGIPSLFIGGYSKGTVTDIGNIPPQGNHAWNAVRIDNKWYLVDATWGAGHVINGNWEKGFDDFYFFTDPESFALSHYPEDQELLFTPQKITKEAFYNTPIFGKAYFKNKLKIQAPLNGELTVKATDSIVFKFDKIEPNVSLHYAFQENMRPTEIDPTCNESGCSFKVPVPKVNRSILYIIANRQTALQYKVNLEK